MTRTPLTAITTLESEGRWAEAVDELERLNRSTDDPALAVALVDLRHRSAPHLVSTATSTPRPPAAADPVPVGASGLPEAQLDEIDGEVLRATVMAHGSLLVRDAIGAGTVARLRELIDQTFAEADREPNERHEQDLYVPLQLSPEVADALGAGRLGIPRGIARKAGGVLLPDAPRAMAHFLEVYADLGLHQIITDYLGDRPTMSALKSTLRVVDVEQVGGWHQDGAFLGEGIHAINMWLALSDCGTTAPGLDIVARRFDHIVEVGTRGAYYDWAVGDDLATEVAGPAGVLRPEFTAGDLLLFDEMFLHRSAVDAEMHLSRHAIEFWCFSASDYPDSHVPLIW